MKKIEAHCSSPENAIRSQISSDFLLHILKGMKTKDADNVVKIFNSSYNYHIKTKDYESILQEYNSMRILIDKM